MHTLKKCKLLKKIRYKCAKQYLNKSCFKYVKKKLSKYYLKSYFNYFIGTSEVYRCVNCGSYSNISAASFISIHIHL